MAEENGLVQIYYGDGKGKTTAAFGLAFRCAGWGRRVVIAQFLKSSPCGELTAAERFPTLTVLRSKGIHKFTFQMNDEEKAVVARNCRKLFQEAVALARAEDARLLVLDRVKLSVPTHLVQWSRYRAPSNISAKNLRRESNSRSAIPI